MNFVRRLALSIACIAGLCLCAAANAQNVANGQSLYNSVCVVCHGFPPAGGPERAAGQPSVIQAAINGKVPAMGFLREVLSPVDVSDIAAYLASLSGPTQPAVPAFDYTDLWWNPSESGWGLNLIQHSSHVIFAVMYTYESTGKATWFVLPSGSWTTPEVYSGALYRVSGPPLDRATFDSASVRVQQVGLATLTFSDRDHGVFNFVVDGRQVTKAITRQPF